MLKSLHVGRGLAALAVLIFHLGISVDHDMGSNPLQTISQYGNRGVDFFFVLSGFIMMLVHEADLGRPERWTNFFKKRFQRIYPVYWVYSALVIAALLAGLGRFPLPTDAASWFASATLLPVAEVVPPLPQAWTLFHEVLFYAVFSLLILRWRVGLVVAGLWLAALLYNFSFPESGKYHQPVWVLFSAYNLNFFLGMAACLLSKRLTMLPAYLFVLCGVASVMLTAYILGPEQFSVGYGAGLALLMSGAAALERMGLFRSAPAVFLLLGDASYSIYLTHEIAIVAFSRAAKIIGIDAPIPYSIWLGVTAVAAGIAAYYLVEKPLLKFVRHRGKVRTLARHETV